MRIWLLIPAAVVGFALSAAAYAHHSFAGSYLDGQTITLEGTIVQFAIRNPHSFISIEVTDAQGNKVLWGGEWGSVSALSEGGVDRFSLKAGEHIIMEGSAPRDSMDHKILVRRVLRPATDKVKEFVWQGRFG